MHWVVLFMHINRLSALNESNSASADLLVIEYVFSVAWCLLWLCVSLCSFCALSTHRWEHSKNGSIFTIWKFSATRSTNVVRARAHNSLRIHLNLHNNPKCSAMSFCRFNYYCLNNFALLAGARATVCCYYYHWSLFSLQIVGRLCMYLYGVCVLGVLVHGQRDDSHGWRTKTYGTEIKSNAGLFSLSSSSLFVCSQPTSLHETKTKTKTRKRNVKEKQSVWKKASIALHLLYVMSWFIFIAYRYAILDLFLF